MIDIAAILRWLVDTSAACTALLLLACGAMLLVRQPARRLRIAELSLAACLILALVQAIPATRFSLGIVNVGRPVRLPWFDDSHGATPAPSSDISGHGAAAAPAHPPPASFTAGRTRLHPSDLLPCWREELLALYAAGVVFMAARLTAGLRTLRRLARSADIPAPPLAALWRDLTGHLQRPVQLGISRRLERPITFGFGRPVVLLPAALAHAGHRDLVALLRHELGHVERRDAFAWLLAAAVNVMLFFLPPLWLLKRQMRLAQEFLADQVAADSAGGPVAYAEMMLRLAALPHGVRCTQRSAGALALGGWGAPSDLLLRIGHLLNVRQVLEHRCTRRWTLAVAACILLLTGVLGAVTLADTSLDSKVRAGELRGVRYLLTCQNRSGGWLTGIGPAPTALVVRSLLQAGVPADHPAVIRARLYVDSCRQSDGGYYTDGEPTYHTAVVLSMYAAFDDAGARARLAAGRQFLDRMLAAENAPAGQWYKSADSLDVAATPAMRFADPRQRAADAILESYGSLTYARWKSLVYAGLSESDPRVKQASRWLKANWTLEKHPGTRSAEGLYYYYLAAAKTLRASAADRLTDPAGRTRDWREELQQRLLDCQSPDGSWLNTQSPRWLENRPELVTAYALLALQETRK